MSHCHILVNGGAATAGDMQHLRARGDKWKSRCNQLQQELMSVSANAATVEATLKVRVCIHLTVKQRCSFVEPCNQLWSHACIAWRQVDV